MKAIARRTRGFTHRVEIGGHRLLVDEPPSKGGNDEGPTPQELLAASLASCAAITLEMYAERKGWDIGPVEVSCEYEPAERGSPTAFTLVTRLACGEEQVERLRAIAAKCPVRRMLEGEVMFDERVEIVTAAGAAPGD